MPTYEYACKSCGEHLEVVQSFKDEALTVCPNCDGELRKVFGSIGIAFKGSGFYKTDSRSKSTASRAREGKESSGGESSTADSKGEAKGGDPKSDSKSDAKPDSKKDSGSGPSKGGPGKGDKTSSTAASAS